jgi:hypothetical protein
MPITTYPQTIIDEVKVSESERKRNFLPVQIIRDFVRQRGAGQSKIHKKILKKNKF